MSLQPQELILAILNNADSEEVTDHLISLLDSAEAGNRAALRYLGSLLRQQTPQYETTQRLAVEMFQNRVEQLEHTQTDLQHQLEDKMGQLNRAKAEVERLRLVKQLHDLRHTANSSRVSTQRETASRLQSQLLELEKTILDFQSRLQSIMEGEKHG